MAFFPCNNNYSPTQTNCTYYWEAQTRTVGGVIRVTPIFPLKEIKGICVFVNSGNSQYIYLNILEKETIISTTWYARATGNHFPVALDPPDFTITSGLTSGYVSVSCLYWG